MKKRFLIIILFLLYVLLLVNAYYYLFEEDLCCVCIDGKFGFIDKQGNFVIKPIYAYAENFVDGLALVQEYNEDYFSAGLGRIRTGYIISNVVLE